jgi:hypothetical protein
VSDPHKWRSERELHSDAIAIGVAALLRDPESTHAVFSGLDRQRVVALAWTLGRFWANTIESHLGADALSSMRRAALAMAADNGEDSR